MNKVFEESGYFFDFSNSLSVYKADKSTYNDLPAVDFVVETENNYLFIEVKNPDNQKSTKESRADFLKDLMNKMYPYKARMKYSDTILRKWAAVENFDKPVICVYILEFSDFSKTERGKLSEKIFNLIPFSLNKQEFCGKEIFSKKMRFKLTSVDEFIETFPDFSVREAT